MTKRNTIALILVAALASCEYKTTSDLEKCMEQYAPISVISANEHRRREVRCKEKLQLLELLDEQGESE